MTQVKIAVVHTNERPRLVGSWVVEGALQMSTGVTELFWQFGLQNLTTELCSQFASHSLSRTLG